MKKHINKNKPVKKTADYGNVPVGIETRPEEKPRPAGLREQILVAESVEEISALLKKGADTYTRATDKTARRWLRAAEIRKAQLNAKK